VASPDIGYLLNKAARRFRLDLAARLAEHGLRPQQAAALMALGNSAGERLTPSQIADAIDMDAPTASGLLDRLARDGWVASIPNPNDGRSRLVVLTDKATAALPSVLQAAHAVSTKAMSSFTPDEARTLRRLLSRLCEGGTDGPDDRGRR